MVAICCPSCGGTDAVIRYGQNRSGSERLRCKACKLCFTPQDRSRALTPKKQEQIEACLAERMSQRAIARALKVSRDTIREVRKKGPNGS
jgi:transposase-like protein